MALARQPKSCGDGKAGFWRGCDGASEAPTASYSAISDGCSFEVGGHSHELLDGVLISEDQTTLREAGTPSGTPLGKCSVSGSRKSVRPCKPLALLFRAQSALLVQARRHRKRAQVTTEPPTLPCSSCVAAALRVMPPAGTPPRLQPNALPDPLASHAPCAAEMDRWAWASGEEV